MNNFIQVGDQASIHTIEVLDPMNPEDDLAEFMRSYFNLTPEEAANTTYSIDPVTKVVSINFGPGLKNTPERNKALMKFLGVSA